jgi:hypothetical protein
MSRQIIDSQGVHDTVNRYKLNYRGCICCDYSSFYLDVQQLGLLLCWTSELVLLDQWVQQRLGVVCANTDDNVIGFDFVVLFSKFSTMII